ncbi:MAG: peroxidase family protein, partial [bacterium]
EEQGFGWKNSHGSGHGKDTITSGLEGAWTTNPVQWDNNFFENLFGYEWKQVKSPAGATQWNPTNADANGTVPDAHDPSVRHAPVMFTTDLALREDPTYAPISKRFHEDAGAFADAFARAWYKMTHRDMGPVTRCLGALVPTEPQIWQDPVPQANPDTMIGEEQITALKEQVLSSGLSVPQLVSTAWASATTFRGTDKRGGANGARIRLAPQKYWEVNQPAQLAEVLQTLEGIQTQFNSSAAGGQMVSLADLIVLAGCAAVEEAAQQGGHAVQVPFTPGRTDATQEQTDVDSFAVLEPTADGFRNYFSAGNHRTSEELLIDRAQMLTLTAPEMTVLVGGLRTLDANAGQTDFGVFTRRPGQLTTDFFVHLLDISTRWQKSDQCDHLYEGLDRSSGEMRWRASAVDLIFGSNSQLQAISEVYACADSQQAFVDDFVSAWVKVMNLDRFDLCRSER